MDQRTHVILQGILGGLHVFVSFPDLHLAPIVAASLHFVLTAGNMIVAGLAHKYNTDGTSQALPYLGKVAQGETVVQSTRATSTDTGTEVSSVTVTATDKVTGTGDGNGQGK